jgi:hypothetical protein
VNLAFGGREVACGFTGTYSNGGAEVAGTALVGKTNWRYAGIAPGTSSGCLIPIAKRRTWGSRSLNGTNEKNGPFGGGTVLTDGGFRVDLPERESPWRGNHV